MCQALRELFEPELNEAVQQGMQQGMRNVILKFLNAGSTLGEISRIMEMSLDEVEAIVKSE